MYYESREILKNIRNVLRYCDFNGSTIKKRDTWLNSSLYLGLHSRR